MRVVALLLAAGQGNRLGGGVPKALVRLEGRTLLEWSALGLAGTPGLDAILPVLPARTSAESLAGKVGPVRVLPATTGGPDRQSSLACGLAALEREAPGAEWVLVHDAARCLVEPGDGERVLAAARESGAALPVVPVVDTLKELREGQVVATLDRARLGAAQTPQAFRLSLLRRALAEALREGFVGTDCASLIERLGARVAAVPGRPENFKVTTPADLERAAALLGARRARGAQPR
jgi:2-C-methyl-D-erythritol 4-phosphate cytidylyltransferase